MMSFCDCSYDYLHTSVTITAAGDTTLISSPGAGKRLVIKELTISSSAASTHNPLLREGTGGTIKKKWLLTSAYNFTIDGWTLPANTALVGSLALAVASGVCFNIVYRIG